MTKPSPALTRWNERGSGSTMPEKPLMRRRYCRGIPAPLRRAGRNPSPPEWPVHAGLREYPADIVFAVRHPQRAFQRSLSQPAWPMWSGWQWVQNTPITVAAQVLGEHVLPVRARFLAAQAGVHDPPAGIVLQDVQVDVVQFHRQRHAHPQHAGLDRGHAARRGRGVGILQGVFTSCSLLTPAAAAAPTARR